MVKLTDSIEMTSEFSQLFWENLVVTVPAEDDECSRELWCKFLRKKPVKLNILKGGNSLFLLLKCNEEQICMDLVMCRVRSIYDLRFTNLYDKYCFYLSNNAFFV